jgi:hypothetical protein
MVERGHPFRLGHPEVTREDGVNSKTVNLPVMMKFKRNCLNNQALLTALDLP